LTVLVSGQAALAAVLYWDNNGATAGFGTAGGTWGTSTNWSTDSTGSIAPTVIATTTADSVNFGTAAAGLAAGTVSVTGTAQGFGAMTFGSASGNITISGGTLNLGGGTIITVNDAADTETISSILAGPAGSLVKAGPGTLTLTGVNTYAGGTTINASSGTLNATVSTSQNSLGTGAVSVGASSTLQLNNTNTSSTTVTINNAFTGAGLLKLNFAANTTARNTSVTNLGGFSGTIELTAAGTTSDKWNLGSLGTIGAAVKINSGTQIFLSAGTGGTTFTNGISVIGTGNNENRGAIRLTAGTLGGNISLLGDTAIGPEGGTLSGNISAGTLSTMTLTVGTGSSTGNATFTGAISNGTGIINLTKAAAGTLTLSGANTYTGNTTISAGTLALTGSGSLYGGSFTNPLTNNGILAFSSSVPHSIATLFSGTGAVRVGGSSGSTLNLNSGGIASTGNGNVIYLGFTASQPGTLNVNGGTIQLDGATATPTIGDVAPGYYSQSAGTVNMPSATSALWIANNVGSAGTTFSVTGGSFTTGGTIVAGVRDTYTFTVGGGVNPAAVSAGTYQVGHTGGNTTGTRTINLNTNGTLTLTNGFNYQFGAATVNLDGGVLRTGSSTANFWNHSPNVTATIGTNGITIDTQTYDNTIRQVLGGTGALTKTGTGTLTLSGANTYIGATNVSAGTLSISELSQTQALSVADGAGLAIAGSSGATLGSPTPLTSVTLGATPVTGSSTLSFRNFVSGTSTPLLATTTLTTNGSVTLNVGGVFTGVNTFPLITYSSIGGDGFGALALGTLPRNVAATLQNPVGAVNLNVTAYNPTTWKGNVNSTWDINTTQNWTVNAVPDYYLNGDIALFDNTAAGSGAVAVALNTAVAPFGVHVDNSSARDYTISGTGGITGTGNLRKTGAGTLTLATANTYSGATLINEGTLSLTGSLAGSDLIVNGTAVLAEGGAGLIAGASSITHNSSGTSTLAGNNTFTGPVTVSAGTLVVGHANALGATGAASGTTVAAGAVLNLNGISLAAETITLNGAGISSGGALVNSSSTAVATAAPIVLASNAAIGGSGNTTLSGNIAGTSTITPETLTKVGAGTVTFSGTPKSYTGETIVDAGTLSLAYNNGGTGTLGGGALTINAGATAVAAVGNALGYSGTNWTRTVNINGGTLRTDATGDNGWGITMNLTGGTVSSGVFGGYYSLGGGSYVNTLASANTSLISANLRIRESNLADVLAFNVADGGAATDLLVSGVISSTSTFGITKSGPGLMRLSAAPTYTGPTTVNEGTLILPSSQGSNGFTVADGATLGITGAAGSSLSTGAMNIGGSFFTTTLSVNNFGSQTLAANAPVKVSTTLNVNGATTLNLAGDFTATGTFPVISYPAAGMFGVGSLTLGVPTRNVTATLQDNGTAKTVDVNVTALNPTTWNGNVVGGVWDVNTTANWRRAGSPDNYVENDLLRFDDTATGTTTVDLTAAVAPSYVRVDNTTKNYTISGSGSIGGLGGLTKSGTGTLTLATTNTYTGTTLVNAGTLQLGDGTTNGSVAGDIVNNAALIVNNPGAVTMGGIVSGAGTLEKKGAGTLVLTAAPTYTGATTVTAGTLQVPSLASTTITTNANLVFQRITGAQENPSGAIAGTGSVAYTGPAVATSLLGQYIVDDANTYGGGTTISNCRVNIQHASGFGTGAVLVTSGGQIYAGPPSAFIINNPITINGQGWPESAGVLGAIRINSGVTFAGPITMASDSRIGVYGSTGLITGVISGNAALEITAANNGNVLTLGGAGANTYNGTTTVTSGQVALAKTGGAVAIPGDIVMNNVNSPQIWTAFSNQVSGSNLLTFVGGSGNARFNLLGTTQTFRGIVNEVSTNNTAVIQNSEKIPNDNSGAPTNALTGTLVLNVPVGEAYTFGNGYLRNSTGTVQVVKNGLGQQVLGGANITYTGTTTVNGGTLVFSKTSALNTSIANAATVEINSVSGDDWILGNGNRLSGAGTWTKTGDGRASFNNTTLLTTGQFSIQAGTLRNNNNASDWSRNTADMDISSGAILDLYADPIYVNRLTGSGYVQSGYGNAAGSQSGASAFIEKLVVGVANGSSTFDGVIRDNATNTPPAATTAGGGTELHKVGTGTLTLTGVNLYTGITNINGGTLALGAGGSIDNTSAVTVASGAVFDVSATAGFTQATGKTLTAGRTAGTGNDVVGAFTTGGTVNVAGSGTPGTLTVSGDLSLTGGGTLQLDLSSSAGSGNDKIATGGNLGLAGTTTVAPLFNGVPDTVNPYTLMTYGGTLSGDATGLSITSALATNCRYSFIFRDPASLPTPSAAGTIEMKVDGTGKALVWSGPAGGVWQADTTTTNWNGASLDYFQHLDTVTFNDTNANGTVTVTGTVTPAAITVGTQDAGLMAYTISGAGSIAGGATLTKTGTNSLTLATANTYAGGTVLSQGTLTLTNVAGAGIGTITIGDANSGANTLTLNANVGSGNFANPITVTNNGTGTVTINQAVALSTLSGRLTLNRATTIVGGPDRTGISGKITGNFAPGILTFSGNRTTLDNTVPNDFVGDVAISTAAILQTNSAACLPATASVTINGTGMFQLNNGYSQTINALNGGTAATTGVQIIAGAAATLTVGAGNGSGTFNGNIVNNAAALSIIKAGTGTQTLAGTGTFTGTTRLTGGTLEITNASALGGSTLVYDNEGGALNYSALTAINLGGLRGAQDLNLVNGSSVGIALTVGTTTNGDNTTYTGALSGAGASFTKAGTGRLILGGAVSNSYTGNTTINSLGSSNVSGMLTLAKTGGAIAIPANTTVNFGTGTTGETALRTDYDNQFGDNVVINFGNATANWCRFDLQGTTQTLAGIKGGSATTQAGAVIQNGNYERYSPGYATLILQVDSADSFYPVGGYLYNGYLRDTDGGINDSRRLALTKNGDGKQTLYLTASGYSGPTTVNGGTLVLAGQTTTTNDYSNSNSYFVASGATLEMLNTFADQTNGSRMTGRTGDVTGTGTVTKTGTGRIYLANNSGSTQLHFNMGSGGLIDVQAGRLDSISTRATNKADLNIAGGAYVLINNAGGSSTTAYFDALTGGSTAANATLEMGRTTVLGVDNGGGTFYGNLVGAGGLTKEGTATLTLSAALSGGIPTSNSSFSGNIVVNGGKLVGAAVRTGSNTVFGLAGSNRTMTVNAGATIEFQAPNTFGNHNVTTVPTLVINGGTVTNADPAVSNAVNNALNNVTLTNGTLTSTAGSNSVIGGPFSRTDTYGAWNINGTVTSSGASSISTTATSNGHVMLASAGSTPWNTTFNVTDGTLAVSAGLIDGDHGTELPSGLIKTGAGTMTVGGTNTYSGPTAVNVGTLSLTGSVQKTSGATVAAGATLDLARAGSASALDVVTPVTNDGLLSVSTAGQQVRAVSGIGTTNVAGGAGLTANSIVQNTLIIGAGGSVTIRDVPTAAGGAANAVPEPGTWVLIGTALVGWLAFRRRRGC
jgi:autotransporter-associated beta strand protein